MFFVNQGEYDMINTNYDSPSLSQVQLYSAVPGPEREHQESAHDGSAQTEAQDDRQWLRVSGEHHDRYLDR